MVIEIKTIVTKIGFGQEVANRFKKRDSKPITGLEKIEVGINTSSNKEEVAVIIYWQSKADFLNWHNSPEHLAGHKKPRPDYILEGSSKLYGLIND